VKAQKAVMELEVRASSSVVDAAERAHIPRRSAGIRIRWRRASPVAIALTIWASSSVCAGAPSENTCSSAVSAAQQLKGAGDFAAARVRLAACVSAGCPRELQECARQLAAIDQDTPTIVVEARDEANDYVTEARATMDGAPLVDRLDGKEILVNPGEHRLTLDAPGFRKAETAFVARESEKRRRVVVFLIAANTAVSTARIVAPAAQPPRARTDRATLSTGRKVGLALGGAGLGGLAVGAVFSIVSKLSYDHALSSECGGDPNRCSANGIADGRRAHDEAGIATVGFVTAAVLLTAGVALYLTSPERGVAVAIAPAVDARAAGLTMMGKW
jgi:hypothetical protein